MAPHHETHRMDPETVMDPRSLGRKVSGGGDAHIPHESRR